jgi:O-succinylbenzoic acid--CoA ligase
MTETVTHVAVRLLNHKEHKGATSYGINMFRTLPNIMIDKDKRGCLVINAPMLNEEVVVTNDLVELLSETEFSWLGRIDHVINSGGIKLIPETLEKKLAPYIAADYFLAGEPHERLGEVLILLIEGEETDPVLLESIRSLSGLLEYERPQNIYYIQNFIRTATGKINRRATFSLIGN